MTKKIAFTLAEVLITLGIIGVVAAITIPNLITNYKATRLKTQFFRVYSILQQVSRNFIKDDLPIEVPFSSNQYYKTFLNYLPGATDCGTSYSKKCVNLSDYVATGYLDDGQIMLADGTIMLFEREGWITVDINGNKNPPNKYGVDVFLFQIVDSEIKTMGDKGTRYPSEEYCSPKAGGGQRFGCAHKAKTDSEYFKWVLKNVK
uniref:Pilin n=1 Tax=uncultured Candidatus Melainabacteria bacterium TaxID=2682970 RepID=A0A650EIZ9_9BACT|nr:hypothetical protein Melaina855_0540 [uncultured Candidatus Melainabacteria bacterium]